MENFKLVLLICLLATPTFANSSKKAKPKKPKLEHIPVEKIKKEAPITYYAPEEPEPTEEELQKNDCYFGRGTSASRLEYIRYEKITRGRNFKQDPN